MTHRNASPCLFLSLFLVYTALSIVICMLINACEIPLTNMVHMGYIKFN